MKFKISKRSDAFLFLNVLKIHIDIATREGNVAFSKATENCLGEKDKFAKFQYCANYPVFNC